MKQLSQNAETFNLTPTLRQSKEYYTSSCTWPSAAAAAFVALLGHCAVISNGQHSSKLVIKVSGSARHTARRRVPGAQTAGRSSCKADLKKERRIQRLSKIEVETYIAHTGSVAVTAVRAATFR